MEVSKFQSNPQFIIAKDTNGREKAVSTARISSIEQMGANSVVLKDDNDKVIARYDNASKTPTELAKECGSILDLSV